MDRLGQLARWPSVVGGLARRNSDFIASRKRIPPRPVIREYAPIGKLFNISYQPDFAAPVSVDILNQQHAIAFANRGCQNFHVSHGFNSSLSDSRHHKAKPMRIYIQKRIPAMRLIHRQQSCNCRAKPGDFTWCIGKLRFLRRYFTL